MEILTSRFGKISFSSKEVYYFSKGIYGFPQENKYVFLKLKEFEPFLWLQSVEKPDLAILLIDPLIFLRDYKPEIPKKELEDIEILDLKKSEIYVTVTPSGKLEQSTLNLLAPIIINPAKKLGKQVVLKSSDYRIQHSIFERFKKNSKKL
jgi:flagellar assembly factor FliW